MDWDAIRRDEFPVTNQWAYFDHAAVSPLPRRAGKALRDWTESQENHGCVPWLQFEANLERIRGNCARLINAHPDEIAFVNSTTQGIGIVAEGFPFKSGDNVVTAAEEYPSNLFPWLNLADRGVTVRAVASREGRVAVDDLVAAIDSSTRLLAISHVEFGSGFRNDLNVLGEICKKREIAFFVDAIQGLGPLTIDVEQTPIDFLAADGHKWLLGPEGAGLLYIRREWIDRLRPTGVGWHSVTTSYNVPTLEMIFKPNAQRWEGGSFNMPGLTTFGASLDLLMEIGPKTVSERILDRAELAREVARRAGWSIFSPAGEAEKSGIVMIERVGIDPVAVSRRLREAGIALAARRGRLRISAHIYNNDDDFSRLSQALSFESRS
jgi:selenocysteine lyase/cysteine desulfurase